MNPHKVLDEVKAIIDERGHDYGVIEENFHRAASIARAAGIDVEAYEVCMVLAAVKMARISKSPTKRDNYLDGIAYLAFAAELMEAQ
jgi:hypothetical protein